MTVQPSRHPEGAVRREHASGSEFSQSPPIEIPELSPEGFIGICQELISPE